jgi:hypothetical protein
VSFGSCVRRLRTGPRGRSLEVEMKSGASVIGIQGLVVYPFTVHTAVWNKREAWLMNSESEADSMIVLARQIRRRANHTHTTFSLTTILPINILCWPRTSFIHTRQNLRIQTSLVRINGIHLRVSAGIPGRGYHSHHT